MNTGPFARRALLTVLALYPAGLVLWKTYAGIGVTTDSVTYAAAASAVAWGDGLLGFDGAPLTIFPPGYPLLLGLVSRAGIPLASAAIALNVVAVALTVLLTYALARVSLGSARQALCATAVVSLASATVATHVYLWSEAPFTVICMAVLVLAARALRGGSMSSRTILTMAMLVSLATTFRYVGVALVPLVAWCAWVSVVPRRATRVAWAVALSLAGLVALVARNVALGSGPLGERYPGSLTAEGALQSVLTLLGGYVAPPRTTSLALVAGVLVGVLLVGGTWLSWVRRARPMQAVSLFVVAYWVLVTYGQTAARLDVVTERLGSPAFPAVVVLASFGLLGIARGAVAQLVSAHRASRARARAAVTIALVLTAVPLVALSAFHGIAYASTPFGRGETIQPPQPGTALALALALPRGVALASNEPARLWWARPDADVLELPPSADEWPTERVARSRARLLDRVRSGELRFLVVSDGGIPIAPLESLASSDVTVRLVERASDGAIYAIEPSTIS